MTWLRRLASPAAIAPILLGIIVVALWQLGAFHAAFNLKPYTVPYPNQIVGAVGESGEDLLEHTLISVPAAIIGYLTGAILGFALGSALVRFAPRLIRQVLPVISATNALPIVALAPVVGLFLGFGLPVKVVVVAIMTTPVMTVYSVRGLLSVDA
jgi:ABC-type nitrate/sulfonate/bicarbonate transport system permease component